MAKKGFLYIILPLVIISLAGVYLIFSGNSSENELSSSKKIDKNLLAGEWIRTDWNYVIKIDNVNEDGTLKAQYFNPNPINVGKANWEESSGSLKIIVELRDINYPGSTYTLNYLPDRDILAGDYYQAVEGITFYVEFSRTK